MISDRYSIGMKIRLNIACVLGKMMKMEFVQDNLFLSSVKNTFI